MYIMIYQNCDPSSLSRIKASYINGWLDLIWINDDKRYSVLNYTDIAKLTSSASDFSTFPRAITIEPRQI